MSAIRGGLPSDHPHRHRPKTEYLDILSLIAAYMHTCKFDGWASFWRVIYVLPGHENDQRLLRHERCHLEQIERDGWVVFSVKYLWWLCRYGYWNNPYKVEARAAEWKKS